ncbi:MAG: ATP-binding protein, partial [Nitrososphaerota archaeon]
MRILRKIRDTIEILTKSDEASLKLGDYLIIKEGDWTMIAQVLDISYAELPGILEDLLRDLTVEETGGSTVIDPYNVSSLGLMMRETRVITGKIRGVMRGSILEVNSAWLPSRFGSTIRAAHLEEVTQFMDASGVMRIQLGTVMGEPFHISARSLDGSLTIITGKKESGKSHLAKLLVEGLAHHGATMVIFDVNGEYVNLGRTVSGGESSLARLIKVLSPGRTLVTTLEQMGLGCFLDILEHVYNTPPTSCRELARVWHMISRSGRPVTISGLLEAITRQQLNESVKEALVSRLQSIRNSGIINDERAPTPLEKYLEATPQGNVIVVELSRLLPSTRRLTVEYLLSTLSQMLTKNLLRPVFLMAEEAHLYLRETYWEDIVTRMRHLGIFPIFVTNQPDTIPDLVYRQADNIFLFNFSNDNDLEKISRISRVDGETVKIIGKTLPPRHCLLMGKIVS